MPTDKDDPTIPMEGPPDPEAVKHLQALMDRAVTFHRISVMETGKLRKRIVEQAEGSSKPSE